MENIIFDQKERKEQKEKNEHGEHGVSQQKSFCQAGFPPAAVIAAIDVGSFLVLPSVSSSQENEIVGRETRQNSPSDLNGSFSKRLDALQGLKKYSTLRLGE